MYRTFFKVWFLVLFSKKSEVYSRKFSIYISFERIIYFPIFIIIVSILLKLEVHPQAQQIKKNPG